MEERVALHHHIPPPGENIPIYVDTLPLGELVPMEDDIKCAVQRLRYNSYRSPSVIRVEHLKHCLWEAQKK